MKILCNFHRKFIEIIHVVSLWVVIPTIHALLFVTKSLTPYSPRPTLFTSSSIFLLLSSKCSKLFLFFFREMINKDGDSCGCSTNWRNPSPFHHQHYLQTSKFLWEVKICFLHKSSGNFVKMIRFQTGGSWLGKHERALRH